MKRSKSNSKLSVPGGIQLFRRQCYEATGGFVPMEIGGEDWYLEIRAKMAGWKVQSFPEYKVYHHRKTGGAHQSIFTYKINEGINDYLMGSNFIFVIFKSFRRLLIKPIIIGTILRFFGYTSAKLKKKDKIVSAEMESFVQQEQLQRIKKLFLIKRPSSTLGN